MYELYKLVFWPSMTAKRLNATAFTKKSGNYIGRESDGIGGFREIFGESEHTLQLNCSRFWFYGARFPSRYDYNFKYNGSNYVIDQGAGARDEGKLLHYSGELVNTNVTLEIKAPVDLLIYCIYYEEVKIPISVGLHLMDPQYSGMKCSKSDGTEITNLNGITSTNLGCGISNLDAPSTYNCGLRCWGTDMRYSYTFFGVKFAVYGTYEALHGNVIIELDGTKIAEVSDRSTRKAYVLLYESNFINSGFHYVNIHQENSDLYEFYKIAYWPLRTAKRLNSTQLAKYGTFTKESDGIGGVREKSSNGEAIAIVSLPCKRFYVFGKKDSGLQNIELSFNGKKEQLIQQSSLTYENTLLYDSGELDLTQVTLRFSSVNQYYLYCIYYEEPEVFPTIPISVGLEI